MRILVFSDLHWFRNRVSYLMETCEWIANLIREDKFDSVVFCGDLNHTHGFVDVETLEAMSRGMGKILRACKEVPSVHLLAGNHDQASRDGEQNVLSVFQEFSNALTYTTRPGLFHFDNQFSGVFCPFPPSTESGKKNYENALKLLLGSLPDTGREFLMFTHWEIKGIPYKPGDIVRNGPHALEARFTEPRLIVNGHYHHPTLYTRKNGLAPIVIVGSPCYHNYSDSLVEDPRGVTILESTFARLKSPSDPEAVNDWLIRRVENPHGPIYHTIKADELTDRQKAVFASRGDRLKLRVKVDEDDNYDDVRPHVVELKDKVDSLRVVGKAAKAHAEEEDILPPQIDSLEQILDSYLASKDLKLDRDRLSAVGRKLLEEANAPH